MDYSMFTKCLKLLICLRLLIIIYFEHHRVSLRLITNIGQMFIFKKNNIVEIIAYNAIYNHIDIFVFLSYYLSFPITKNV